MFDFLSDTFNKINKLKNFFQNNETEQPEQEQANQTNVTPIIEQKPVTQDMLQTDDEINKILGNEQQEQNEQEQQTENQQEDFSKYFSDLTNQQTDIKNQYTNYRNMLRNFEEEYKQFSQPDNVLLQDQARQAVNNFLNQFNDKPINTEIENSVKEFTPRYKKPVKDILEESKQGIEEGVDKYIVKPVGHMFEQLGQMIKGYSDTKHMEQIYKTRLFNELTPEQQNIFNQVFYPSSSVDFSVRVYNIYNDETLSDEEKAVLMDKELQSAIENKVLPTNVVDIMKKNYKYKGLDPTQVDSDILQIAVKNGEIYTKYFAPTVEEYQKEQEKDIDKINQKYLSAEEAKAQENIKKITEESNTQIDSKINVNLKQYIDEVKNDTTLSNEDKQKKLYMINDKVRAIQPVKSELQDRITNAKAIIEQMKEDLKTGRIGRSYDGTDVSDVIKNNVNDLEKKIQNAEKEYIDLINGYVKSGETNFQVYLKSRLDNKGYKDISDIFGVKSDLLGANKALDEYARGLREQYLLQNGNGIDKVIGGVQLFTMAVGDLSDLIVNPVQDQLNRIFGGENIKGLSTMGLIKEAQETNYMIQHKGYTSATQNFAFGLVDAADEIAELVGINKFTELGKIGEGLEAMKGIEAGKETATFFKRIMGEKTASLIEDAIKGISKSAGDYLKKSKFINDPKQTANILKYTFNGILKNKSDALIRVVNRTIDTMQNISISQSMNKYYNLPYTTYSADFAVDMAFQYVGAMIEALKFVNHIPKGTIEYTRAFEEEFAKRIAGIGTSERDKYPQRVRDEFVQVAREVIKKTNNVIEFVSSGKPYTKTADQLIEEGKKLVDDGFNKVTEQFDKVNKIKRNIEDYISKGKEVPENLLNRLKKEEEKLYQLKRDKDIQKQIDEGYQLINDGKKLKEIKGSPDRWKMFWEKQSKIMNDIIENNKPFKQKVEEIRVKQFIDNPTQVYINKGVVDKLGETFLNDIIEYYKSITRKEKPELEGLDYRAEVKINVDRLVSQNTKGNKYEFVKSFVNKEKNKIFTPEELNKVREILNRIPTEEEKIVKGNDLIFSKLRLETLKNQGADEEAIQKAQKEFNKKLDDLYNTSYDDLFEETTSDKVKDLKLVPSPLTNKEGKLEVPTNKLGKRGTLEINGKLYRYHIKSDFNPRKSSQLYESEHTTKYYLMSLDFYNNHDIKFGRLIPKKWYEGDYILLIDGQPMNEHQITFQDLNNTGERKMSIHTTSELGVYEDEIKKSLNDIQVTKEQDYLLQDTDYLSDIVDEEKHELYSSFEVKGGEYFRNLDGHILGQYIPDDNIIKLFDTTKKLLEENPREAIITLYHEGLHTFVHQLKEGTQEYRVWNKILNKVKDIKNLDLEKAEEFIVEALAKDLGKKASKTLYQKFLNFLQNLIDTFTRVFFGEKNKSILGEEGLVLQKMFNDWLGLRPEDITNNVFKKLNKQFGKTSNVNSLLAHKQYFVDLFEALKEKGIKIIFDYGVEEKYVDPTKLNKEDIGISYLRTKVASDKKDLYKEGKIIYPKDANENDMLLVDYSDDTWNKLIKAKGSVEKVIEDLQKSSKSHLMIIKNLKDEANTFGLVLINKMNYDLSTAGKIEEAFGKDLTNKMKMYLDLKNKKYIRTTIGDYLYTNIGPNKLSYPEKASFYFLRPDLAVKDLKEKLFTKGKTVITNDELEYLEKKYLSRSQVMISDVEESYLKSNYGFEPKKRNHIPTTTKREMSNKMLLEEYRDYMYKQLGINNYKELMQKAKTDDILKKYLDTLNLHINKTYFQYVGSKQHKYYRVSLGVGGAETAVRFGHNPFFIKNLGLDLANTGDDIIKFRINGSMRELFEAGLYGSAKEGLGKILDIEKKYNPDDYIITSVSESGPIFIAFRKEALRKNPILVEIANNIGLNINELNYNKLSLLVYGTGTGILKRESAKDILEDGKSFGYLFVKDPNNPLVKKYTSKSAKYFSKYFSDRPKILVDKDIHLLKLFDYGEKEDGTRGIISDEYNKYFTKLSGGPLYSSNVSKVQVNFNGHNIKGEVKSSTIETIVGAILNDKRNLDQLNKYLDKLGKEKVNIDDIIDYEIIKKNVLLKDKNNFKGLSITPKTTKGLKDVNKANVANAFIGFTDNKNSSTYLYKKQIEKKYGKDIINKGKYNKHDIVFVSIVGKRGTLESRLPYYKQTLDEVKKVLDAGGTIVTDTEEYIKNSSYNEGEKYLHNELKKSGYKYYTIDLASDTQTNKKIGVWINSQKEKLKKDLLITRLKEEYNYITKTEYIIKKIKEGGYKRIYETIKDLIDNNNLHGFVYDTAHKIYTNDEEVKNAITLNLKNADISDYGFGGKKASESNIQNLSRQADAMFPDPDMREKFLELLEKHNQINKEKIELGFKYLKYDYSKGIEYLKKALPKELQGYFDYVKRTKFVESYLVSLLKQLYTGTQQIGYGTKGIGIGEFEYNALKKVFANALGGDEEFILLKRNNLTKDFKSGDKIFIYRNPINSPRSLQRKRILFIDDIGHDTIFKYYGKQGKEIYDKIKKGELTFNDLEKIPEEERLILNHLEKTLGQYDDTIGITKKLAKDLAGDFDGDDYYLLTDLSKDDEFKKLMDEYTNSDFYKSFPSYKGQKKLEEFNDMFGIVLSRIHGKVSVGKETMPHKMLRELIPLVKNLKGKEKEKALNLIKQVYIEQQKSIQDAVDGMAVEGGKSIVNLGNIFGLKEKELNKLLSYNKNFTDIKELINERNNIDLKFGDKKDKEFLKKMGELLSGITDNIQFGRYKGLADRLYMETFVKELQNIGGEYKGSYYDVSSTLATLVNYDLVGIDRVGKGLFIRHERKEIDGLFEKRFAILMNNIKEKINKMGDLISFDIDKSIVNKKEIKILGKKYVKSGSKEINKLKDGEFFLEKIGEGKYKVYVKDTSLKDLYAKKIYGTIFALNEISPEKLPDKLLKLIPDNYLKEFKTYKDILETKLNHNELLGAAGLFDQDAFNGERLSKLLAGLELKDGQLKYNFIENGKFNYQQLDNNIKSKRTIKKGLFNIYNYSTEGRLVYGILGDENSIKNLENEWKHYVYKDGEYIINTSDSYAGFLDDIDNLNKKNIKESEINLLDDTKELPKPSKDKMFNDILDDLCIEGI